MAQPRLKTTKHVRGNKTGCFLASVIIHLVVFTGQCLILLLKKLCIFKGLLVLLTDLTWIRRTERSGRWDKCTCWAWSRNRLHMNSDRSLQRRKGRRVKQHKNTRCQVEDGPVLTLWRRDLASAREKIHVTCLLLVSLSAPGFEFQTSHWILIYNISRLKQTTVKIWPHPPFNSHHG